MREVVSVKVKKLFSDAKLPVFSTDGAAGADLHAYVPRFDSHTLHDEKGPFLRIYPGDRKVIWAGIAMEIPPGYEAQIRPRSGLAIKSGISIVNAPGTVDSDYRGEIGAIIINHGTFPFDVHTGDRIAQVVIKPVPAVKFIESDELTDTKRDDGRFGSTGVSS
jgi:dUTP pyrophosphatase